MWWVCSEGKLCWLYLHPYYDYTLSPAVQLFDNSKSTKCTYD